MLKNHARYNARDGSKFYDNVYFFNYRLNRKNSKMLSDNYGTIKKLFLNKRGIVELLK